MKVDVCGVKIDKCAFDEAVEAVVHYALSSVTPKYVVTPNVHRILLLQKDAHFREIYENAFFCLYQTAFHLYGYLREATAWSR